MLDLVTLFQWCNILTMPGNIGTFESGRTIGMLLKYPEIRNIIALHARGIRFPERAAPSALVW